MEASKFEGKYCSREFDSSGENVVDVILTRGTDRKM